MQVQLLLLYFCAWERKQVIWNRLNESSIQPNTLQEADGKEKAAWTVVARQNSYVLIST